MPRDLEGRVVDTGPLDHMIAGAATVPLRAEDPRQPGQFRPFSAAHVRIMGEEGCYLYIVLGNEAFDASLAATARGLWAQGALRFLPVALLITAGLGLFLFGAVTRPLRRLTAAAEAIGGGDLDRRVPVTGADEIGRLGVSFNRMAETLADTLRRLEQTDSERRALVANVSHDLRSPLAAVRGYLETALMKGDDVDRSETRRYVEIALRNAEGLGSLVEELFELSKLDAGGVRPRPEPFAAADLVQDVAARFGPRAAEGGQRLTLDLEERLPLVCGDLGLIERVIANLVDNALRYTPAGGVVELAAVRAEGGATIRVRDNGPGIPPELLGRVTERFVRGQVARTRGRDGAGLGLAIAERILALHGTSLRIESAQSGTSVSFTLPTESECG
jgi:signal transduction histidine kinase